MLEKEGGASPVKERALASRTRAADPGGHGMEVGWERPIQAQRWTPTIGQNLPILKWIICRVDQAARSQDPVV